MRCATRIATEAEWEYAHRADTTTLNAFGNDGDVWEWVADWYGENYYAESPVHDPKGPLTRDVRVRRGGGWNSFPIWIRSSFRNWGLPDSRCVNLGFRVALDTQ